MNGGRWERRTRSTPRRWRWLTVAWLIVLSLLPVSAWAQGEAAAELEAANRGASQKDGTAEDGTAEEEADGTGEDDGDEEQALPEGDLRVGYAGSAPFVMDGRDGDPAGIAIEVWSGVASRIGSGFRLEARDSVEDALRGVEEGELDVAVGPISITAERAKRVAFSQPYYRSSLAIASAAGSGIWARLQPFISTAFLSGAGLLLLVLGIVGTLTWLAERRHNSDHFPQAPIAGIGNGIWYALVTMTTVGYGDRVPKTPMGRVISGVWMIIALISVSSLTAGIATALTLSGLDSSSISKAGELESRAVAVVDGTISERFARAYGAEVAAKPDLAAAVEAVSAGDAEAVVFDRPALMHYLSEHPEIELEVSPRRYEERGYGFAVPHGSPLEKPLDVALLGMRQEGVVPPDVGGEVGADAED